MGVKEKNLKGIDQDLPTAVRMIEAGRLDAVFMVGGVPQPQVTQLLAEGKGRLVPIDGPGRDRSAET